MLGLACGREPSALKSSQRTFTQGVQEAYPFPSLRDNSLDELVVIAFLINGFIDDSLIFRIFLLLNASRGSNVRIDPSSDHLSAEGPPDARSIPGHPILRLLQCIRGIRPHLIHLEPQAIDCLLQQQVLCLLVIQGTIRLLSQFEICGELVNPVLENLLLPVPFICFNRV